MLLSSLWISSLLVGTIVCLAYVFLSSANKYWKKRGVPCPKPELLFGHARRVLFVMESLQTMLHRIYQQLHGEPFGGFYTMTTPCILLRDIKLINHVLVADFQHFTDRFKSPSPEVDPLSQHICGLGGTLWKEMRTRMSAAFSVSQTRRAFFLIQECCTRLQNSVHSALKDPSGRDFALKDLLSTFTTDAIGMCAFGIECGTIDDPNSQFRQIGKMVFPETKKGAFRVMFAFIWPELAKLFRATYFSSTVAEFFDRVVLETFQYRKEKSILRDDLLHLMMQLKEKGLVSKESSEKIDVSDQFLVAQMLMAFTLGFEMTASTMSFCLHELSFNPELQTRLLREIDAALSRHGGEITYEALQEMSYLDMVVAETLRLYPPLGWLSRRCTKPYRMPDTDVVLQEGTMVYVPVLSLHRDPNFFPDPLRFNPERFANLKKPDVPDALFTYLPFGDGPRTCLGQKYALVVVKAGLAALLSRFEFRRCSRSSGRPADFEEYKVLGSPSGGLWVRVISRPWLPLQ